MRRALLATVAALAGGFLAMTGWLCWTLLVPRSDHQVELVIEPGEPTGAVLASLHDRGLIPSTLAAHVYLRIWARGRAPQYGSYLIPSDSRPLDVLEQILRGRVEMVTVTIPEGEDSRFIGERLTAAGLASIGSWPELVARREWIADIAPQATSLEGFLFPDTYRFAVGTRAASAVKHMVERFRQVWTDEVTRAAPTWGSPYEVVVLASMVEAETSLDGERARVAGVFVNRLRRGMLMQCDPTVVYALKRRGEWQGRLLRIHWEVDDPYNTYLFPGLPPGPINSPGRAALAAALAPEQHSFLYFVARAGGGHTFSRTLAEHNRAVAALRHSRR